MKKLRVLVLMHEHLVPPEGAGEYDDTRIVDWRTEYDVLDGLERLGHEVHGVGVGSDLGAIREAILEGKPHIAFNLLEEFHDVPVYDQHVASYLELMRQRYTGCNPRGLMLCHDKALSKKILTYHRIRVPGFMVFPKRGRVLRPRKLAFPLIVKSLIEEGSIGLAQASVVRSDDKLKERVEYIHDQLGTDAIAEEYIPGREFYLTILGNRRLQTLPVVELAFRNLAEGAEPIATRKVKYDWEYQKQRGIELSFPTDLPEDLVRRINRVGKRVYKALNMSGYGRVDLRVREDGEIVVLEANPNADLAYREEMCESAAKAGIDYPQLLQRILSLGLSYQAEWRLTQV